MQRRSFLAMTASLALAPLAGSMSAQTSATQGDTSLAAMLGLLPDDAMPENGFVRYANYTLQLEAMGIQSPRASLDIDTWLGAVRELSVPRAMERAFLDPIWRDSFGFDARDLDVYLECGSITIMRGSIEWLNMARLQQMGYEPVETNGQPWHTIGDVNLLETDHLIHTLHLGLLRHVAVLDNRTVVGTSEVAEMERVLALHAGGAGSFAEGRGAGMTAAPDDLVLADIIEGTSLIPDLDPELVARLSRSDGMTEEEVAVELEHIREEASRMPAIELALLGLTAGWIREEERPGVDAPRSRSVAVISPEVLTDAEMVAETIARRLTTEQVPESALIGARSWAEAFPGIEIDTAPGGESVVVKLTPADDVPSNRLLHLLRLRELSIFNWIDAENEIEAGSVREDPTS